MPIIVGIDTGGTNTDGVVMDTTTRQVLAQAKAPTTHHNLALGITGCLEKLEPARFGGIAMVCFSTTLATNAVAEGRYAPTGLLFLGKRAEGAFAAVQVELLPGQLDIKGRQTSQPKAAALGQIVERFRGRVETMAVSGYASVRNPLQELAVKKAIEEQLGLPVVCAHQLTQNLGFGQRTATAVLNAGLIPVIRRLLASLETALQAMGISAPVMVVKGNGHLMRASYALERPVETILSGLAASVAGARFLSRQAQALVVDMGGTTTDIALVGQDGAPIQPEGASIAGRRTFVEAVDSFTLGLGGDSRVILNAIHHLEVGPARVTPLCAAGTRHPALAEELGAALGRLEQEDLGFELFGCFGPVPGPSPVPEDEEMAALLAALKDGPHTLLHLAGRGFAVSRLEALVKAGAVEAIGLTPTDILCAEGQLDSGCYHTARLGTEALARCMGLPLAALFPRFHTEMTRRLAEACLQALASFETRDDRRLDHPAARYFLDKALGLATPSEDKLAVTLGLCRPIVAVGAPAAAWMAPVAATLHTSLATPPYAGVACAIGAAVGNVAETVRVLIRPDPATGDYILHGLAGRQRCQSLEAAKAAGLEQARHQAKEKALAAGCPNCGLAESCKDIITDTGRPTENYVETHIQVTAYGPAVLPQEEEPPRCP